MTLGVEGNFVASFSIGDFDDFLESSDLIEFSLEEQAGNLLPIFRITFNAKNERIFAFLNEGNPLSMSIGSQESNSKTSRLVCTGIKTFAPSGNSQMISAEGLYDAVGYYNGSNINIFSDKKSVEVLGEIAVKHFLTDADENTEDALPSFSEIRTFDNMNWIQPFMTDKSFVDHVWLRSYMEDSFLGLGIDSFGNFIVKDMKSNEGEPDWTFNNTLSGVENNIRYDTDFEITSRSGLVNKLIGYGSQATVARIEENSETLVTEFSEPILASTDALDRKNGINPNQTSTKMQSKNVHENYWRAIKKNKASLGQFSNVTLRVSFAKVFKDIRVLDLVHFSTQKPSIGVFDSSSEYLSGLYFVSSVTRRIQNNNLLTIVDLCRESFNQLEGGIVDPETEFVEPTSELTQSELESTGLDQNEPT